MQLARNRGAYVSGLASGRNEEFVRGLGADEFVDHTKQPFEEIVKDVDVVLDAVGGDTFQRTFHTLKKGGFMVTSVAFPEDEAQQFGVSVKRAFCTPNAEELTAIRELRCIKLVLDSRDADSVASNDKLSYQNPARRLHLQLFAADRSYLSREAALYFCDLFIPKASVGDTSVSSQAGER